MTKDRIDAAHAKYQEAIKTDPTFATRVGDAQFSTYDGSDDWDMDAAFITAVESMEARA